MASPPLTKVLMCTSTSCLSCRRTFHIHCVPCQTPCVQGVKRTKLGLREFIRLGDLTQEIDVAKGEAVRGATRCACGRLAADLPCVSAGHLLKGSIHWRGQAHVTWLCSQVSHQSGVWPGFSWMLMQSTCGLCVWVSQTNSVEFSVAGISFMRGGLHIRASFVPESPSRVNITFQEATLVSGQNSMSIALLAAHSCCALWRCLLQHMMQQTSPHGSLQTMLTALACDDKGTTSLHSVVPNPSRLHAHGTSMWNSINQLILIATALDWPIQTDRCDVAAHCRSRHSSRSSLRPTMTYCCPSSTHK